MTTHVLEPQAASKLVANVLMVCEREHQDLGNATEIHDLMRQLGDQLPRGVDVEALTDLLAGCCVQGDAGEPEPVFQVLDLNRDDLIREFGPNVPDGNTDNMVRFVLPETGSLWSEDSLSRVTPQLAGLDFQQRRTFLAAVANSCRSQPDGYYAIDWEVAEVSACCAEHVELESTVAILEMCCRVTEEGDPPLFSVREVPCDCGECANTVRLYEPTDSMREVLAGYEDQLRRRQNRAERRATERRRRRPKSRRRPRR